MSGAVIEAVDRHYYAVKVGGEVRGYTFSHPRCLPRSWSVRWSDGTGPFNGTEARAWFRTRREAVAYIEAHGRACEACGAEPGEDCRPGCTAWPRSDDDF